jgi:hypothetical protein
MGWLSSMQGHWPASRVASCADWIEKWIVRTYVQLAAALDHAGRPKTVTLFRGGSFEVRPTKMAQDIKTSLSPFLLELWSSISGAIIDSLGCNDFNDDELTAAVEFVLEATQRGLILPVDRLPRIFEPFYATKEGIKAKA